MKSSLLFKAYFILNPSLRKKFLIFLLFTFFAVFFEILSIAIIIPIFDLIQDPDNFTYFIQIFKKYPFIKDNLIPFSAFLFLIVFSIKTLYMVFYSKYKSDFIFRIERDLSTETLSIYLNKSFEDFRKINTAFIARDILGELSVFRNFLISISLLVVEILDVVGILFLMFYANFYSTLYSILFISISSSLILIFVKNKTIFIGRRRLKVEGLRLKETNLVLQNYKYIKVNQLESKSLERTYNLSNELSKILSLNDFLKNAPKYLLEFIGLGSVMVYILVSFYFSPNNNIFNDITPLVIFLYGSIKLMPSANRIISSINNFSFSKVTVNKLHELFSSNVNLNYHKDICFRNCIKLKNLSFKYPDSNNFVLYEFSHLIRKFDMVCILGSSGKGKSTLINLILGLLSPTSGTIYIDNEVLDNQSIQSFRKNIGYIPQDFVLLDDSIINNISYFDKSLDLVRINQLINEFGLFDVNQRLLNSENSSIGENGNRLSGGQRQRIALARAAYKNSSILILDEPFSALDDLSSEELIYSINKLKNEFTIIIITHKIPSNLEYNNIINL